MLCTMLFKITVTVTTLAIQITLSGNGYAPAMLYITLYTTLYMILHIQFDTILYVML
jgi:hypothetical protein